MKSAFRFQLDPKCVLLSESSDQSESIIWELCQFFRTKLNDGNVQTFYDYILKRESESTTYLGHGVAIPHARVQSVSTIGMAVARLEKPVLWGGMQESPTRIVILLGVPLQSIQPYLEMMKALIHGFRKKGLEQRIYECADAQAVSQLLTSTIAKG